MKARLVKIRFLDKLNIVVLDGQLWHDNSICGSEKAALAKKELGIPEHQPLIAALGERGKVAMVRETADEWELIIPHDLLLKLGYEETGIAVFARHPRLPITHRWKSEQKTQVEDEFQLWNEGEDEAAIRGVIPNLSLPYFLTIASPCDSSEKEPDTEENSPQEQSLVHKGSPEIFSKDEVAHVQIQANNRTNGHQEIRVYFKESQKGDSNNRPICARISRTNGFDEVEISTKQKDSFEELPCIFDDHFFSGDDAVTFGQIYDCFRKARNEILRYDRGNCVVLSRKIMSLVAPEKGYYLTETQEEDLFAF